MHSVTVTGAPQHVGSSQIRDQTCVSCTGRQILTTELPGKPKRCCLEKSIKKLLTAWETVAFLSVESCLWKRMEDLGILKWSGGVFSFKIKNIGQREKVCWPGQEVKLNLRIKISWNWNSRQKTTDLTRRRITVRRVEKKILRNKLDESPHVFRYIVYIYCVDEYILYKYLDSNLIFWLKLYIQSFF